MQQTVTIALFSIASFIAIGNLCGVLVHAWRSRRGMGGGFSTVPLLTLGFVLAAYLTGPRPFGPWVWAPAVVDPATWCLAYLPVFLLRQRSGESEVANRAPPERGKR